MLATETWLELEEITQQWKNRLAKYGLKSWTSPKPNTWNVVNKKIEQSKSTDYR